MYVYVVMNGKSLKEESLKRIVRVYTLLLF